MKKEVIVALNWMDTFLIALIVILTWKVDMNFAWLFPFFASWQIIKSIIIMEN